MHDAVRDDLRTRIARLERRSAAGWIVSAALGAALLAGLAQPGQTPQELRAQRLVIEDAQGRPRIILAAPIRNVPGRVRHDEASGVLLLDEQGVDRVILGSPTTNPQVQGEVSRRIGPSHGINFNDANGDERGGLGVIDSDGRAVLGLDSQTGEGAALFVTPQYTGLIVNGGEGTDRGQRAFLGTSAARRTTVLNLDDYDGKRRFQVTLDGNPRLEFFDDDSKPLVTIPRPADN